MEIIVRRLHCKVGTWWTGGCVTYRRRLQVLRRDPWCSLWRNHMCWLSRSRRRRRVVGRGWRRRSPSRGTRERRQTWWEDPCWERGRWCRWWIFAAPTEVPVPWPGGKKHINSGHIFLNHFNNSHEFFRNKVLQQWAQSMYNKPLHALQIVICPAEGREHTRQAGKFTMQTLCLFPAKGHQR